MIVLILSENKLIFIQQFIKLLIIKLILKSIIIRVKFKW